MAKHLTEINQIFGFHMDFTKHLPSVLSQCFLSGRKGIKPVENIELVCLGFGDLTGALCISELQFSPLPPPPSSLAGAKSRIVRHSDTGLPRLSCKVAVKVTPFDQVTG